MMSCVPRAYSGWVVRRQNGREGGHWTYPRKLLLLLLLQTHLLLLLLQQAHLLPLLLLHHLDLRLRVLPLRRLLLGALGVAADRHAHALPLLLLHLPHLRLCVLLWLRAVALRRLPRRVALRESLPLLLLLLCVLHLVHRVPLIKDHAVPRRQRVAVGQTMPVRTHEANTDDESGHAPTDRHGVPTAWAGGT